MLTIKQVQAAKPEGKTRKLFDGGGLYLEITPRGSKLWRLKYRHAGREKRISFGAFPEVSLREARDRREEARRLLRDGIDPSFHRKAKREALAGADSFEAVAREWLNQQRAIWKPTHADAVELRLERDVFPVIGRTPIDALKAPEVLALLRRIEGRGAVHTAHRAAQKIGQVMRYGVATGRCDGDVTRDLRGALKPEVVRHRAAILEPRRLGGLLRAIDSYDGHATTAWALRLAPLVFVRPGELRHAEWSEMDLDNATWTIPGAKTKMGRDHVVPLASQALAILREAESLTGRGSYVFPSLRSKDRAMSDNTLNAALRRMGYSTADVSVHGFRATARTLLDEKLGERLDLIEHQLAHKVRDPLGRAYNRTTFVEERREMMQRWADYLDELRAAAT